MNIYRLTPIAAADDPNWDLGPSQGIVVVRAESPADARIVASEAEDDFLESDGKPSHGASTRFASAFRDNKRYSVSEMSDSPYSADGPREVLEGDIGPAIMRSDAANRHGPD